MCLPYHFFRVQPLAAYHKPYRFGFCMRANLSTDFRKSPFRFLVEKSIDRQLDKSGTANTQIFCLRVGFV